MRDLIEKMITFHTKNFKYDRMNAKLDLIQDLPISTVGQLNELLA